MFVLPLAKFYTNSLLSTLISRTRGSNNLQFTVVDGSRLVERRVSRSSLNGSWCRACNEHKLTRNVIKQENFLPFDSRDEVRIHQSSLACPSYSIPADTQSWRPVQEIQKSSSRLSAWRSSKIRSPYHEMILTARFHHVRPQQILESVTGAQIVLAFTSHRDVGWDQFGWGIVRPKSMYHAYIIVSLLTYEALTTNRGVYNSHSMEMLVVPGS